MRRELRLLRPSDSGIVQFDSSEPLRFTKHPRPLLLIREINSPRARKTYVYWVPFSSRVSAVDLETLTKLLNGEEVVDDLDEGPEVWV